MIIVVFYLAIINLISSIVVIADKIKAKNERWRISEKTLFILAFLGGAPLEYLTMKTIRHKTLHKRFMIGLPLIISVQLTIEILIFLKVAHYI